MKFWSHYDDSIVNARCIVLGNRLFKPFGMLSWWVFMFFNILAKLKETEIQHEMLLDCSCWKWKQKIHDLSRFMTKGDGVLDVGILLQRAKCCFHHVFMVDHKLLLPWVETLSLFVIKPLYITEFCRSNMIKQDKELNTFSWKPTSNHSSA